MGYSIINILRLILGSFFTYKHHCFRQMICG